MKAIIQIALETGMRQGEILRIKSEHIQDQTLFIPIAKTRPRTIPLTKKAFDILKNTIFPFGLNAHYNELGYRKVASKIFELTR